MEITLRDGTEADAADLARLHVAVWRETYRKLAPTAALAQLDENRRLPYWQDALTSGDPQVGVIVALQEGQPVGVISFGPPRHEAMAGGTEIKHLYVARSTRGTGLGRLLLRAAFDRLRDRGVRSVALAVVEENTDARAFYARLGGTEIGGFTDPGPLWRSSNRVVRWTL